MTPELHSREIASKPTTLLDFTTRSIPAMNVEFDICVDKLNCISCVNDCGRRLISCVKYTQNKQFHHGNFIELYQFIAND